MGTPDIITGPSPTLLLSSFPSNDYLPDFLSALDMLSQSMRVPSCRFRTSLSTLNGPAQLHIDSQRVSHEYRSHGTHERLLLTCDSTTVATVPALWQKLPFSVDRVTQINRIVATGPCVCTTGGANTRPCWPFTQASLTCYRGLRAQLTFLCVSANYRGALLREQANVPGVREGTKRKRTCCAGTFEVQFGARSRRE